MSSPIMEWFKLINGTSLDAIMKPDGKITNNLIFGKNLINGISTCFITLSRFPDILIKIDEFVVHLNTFTRNILFHEFDPIQETMSTSIMRFANSFAIARDDLHRGVDAHLVADKLGRILDTWNRDLESFSSSGINLRHRENDTTIFDILEQSRTGAKSSLIHFSRTLINYLFANPGYKKCFAQALIGILPNEKADRMESFLRKYIAKLGFNQDELKFSIDFAYELREKFGINLFRNNSCLLTLIPPPYIPPWEHSPPPSSLINPFNHRPSWMQTPPPLCEKKIQVLIRGDIFALSYIASSQFYLKHEEAKKIIMNSSGGELQMFENGLRKYVDGVRWFWRQKDIKSYTFPLSSAWKNENWSELKNVAKLFEGLVDFSLPIIHLRDSQRFISPKLSTEIIKYIIGFVAPEFPKYFEKFLNNLYSVYPVLLSLGRITDNPVQFAERFHNIGGIIVRASLLSGRSLSQPHVLELLDIGYLFIKLIRSFEGTGTGNLIIHVSSLLAASNCIGIFEEYLNQKSISNRSFLSHISTFMNGVIELLIDERNIWAVQLVDSLED